jgi:hypothetical protein
VILFGAEVLANVSALPGPQWMSAGDRSSGMGALTKFEVKTDWNEFLTPDKIIQTRLRAHVALMMEGGGEHGGQHLF